MITRAVNPLKVLEKQKSVLLLGPRGTGKTVLLRQLIESKSNSDLSILSIDLLQGGDFQRYLANPSQLTKEVEDKALRLEEGKSVLVLIDEVQKVPALLDEAHHLIEKYHGRIVFLFSGSSARKLKRGGANLLAGRAISSHLFPLNQLETNLSLSRALQFGTMPGVYLSNTGLEVETLESYVSTYLQEEIQQESLVRGIERFSRFLEFAAQSNGQPVNFAKLGKQLGIAGKTAAGYFSILCDTLIANEISGWSTSVRRQLLQAPKFYFFDCGVLNALNGYLRIDLREGGYVYGNLFETFVINQLLGANHYYSLGFRFYYWRDKDGREIDLLLARNAFEPVAAIEIKSSTAPTVDDCPGFLPFKEEYAHVPRLCACNTPRSYTDDEIRFIPWKELVTDLKKIVQ
ncbi:MAG: ATP-binding protein [Deltaproteobacteria bacterium]|nr:ATP-binding protein [Deltaproteobacteria bacterium]